MPAVRDVGFGQVEDSADTWWYDHLPAAVRVGVAGAVPGKGGGWYCHPRVLSYGIHPCRFSDEASTADASLPQILPQILLQLTWIVTRSRS